MSQQLRSATDAEGASRTNSVHPVGQEFVRALAGQDGAALRAVLADPIDFAALTPSRAWQSTSPDEVAAEIILGRWFGPGREVLGVESLGGGHLPDREHVSYRLAVRKDDGDYLVEQQAYFNTTAGAEAADGAGRLGGTAGTGGLGGLKISWLRVLCSGYQLTSPR